MKDRLRRPCQWQDDLHQIRRDAELSVNGAIEGGTGEIETSANPAAATTPAASMSRCVVLGTILLQILQNLVNLLGIPNSLNFAVMGSLILFGVIVDQQFSRRRAQWARL